MRKKLVIFLYVYFINIVLIFNQTKISKVYIAPVSYFTVSNSNLVYPTNLFYLSAQKKYFKRGQYNKMDIILLDNLGEFNVSQFQYKHNWAENKTDSNRVLISSPEMYNALNQKLSFLALYVEIKFSENEKFPQSETEFIVKKIMGSHKFRRYELIKVLKIIEVIYTVPN